MPHAKIDCYATWNNLINCLSFNIDLVIHVQRFLTLEFLGYSIKFRIMIGLSALDI